MDDQLKQKWLEYAAREVATQSKLARVAYESIRGQLGTDGPFILVQAFLTHTANASKMLQASQEPFPILRYEYDWRKVFQWLRSCGLVKRGPTIGDLLGIDRGSPLHGKARQFRNHLEHYDDRLYSWLRKHGPNVNIADFNVMPRNAIRAPAGAIVFIRNIDPQTLIFTFLDKDLDTGVLIEELDRIRGIADRYVADVEARIRK
jgi:succinate dehydrogenase flavin-adding protein (antitoxin of CptAB toxin-antitoxin module)